MTTRTQTNMSRAYDAVKALRKATTDHERLAAAQALESAACQLRRELKKTVQA